MDSQTLLLQNGWLPNGTDFPVENIEPLFTFFAAVFRTNHDGNPAGGWHFGEGLTHEQTLRSMTIRKKHKKYKMNTKTLND